MSNSSNQNYSNTFQWYVARGGTLKNGTFNTGASTIAIFTLGIMGFASRRSLLVSKKK